VPDTTVVCSLWEHVTALLNNTIVNV